MSQEHAIQLTDALKRRIAELASVSGLTPETFIREAVEEFAARRNGRRDLGDSCDLLEKWARIMEGMPEEELQKLPPDLAKNFDHYHYGHPRED